MVVTYASIDKILRETTQACLSKADLAGVTSIAFPAFGRDSLNYPADKVVWCMITAIVEYYRDHPDPFTCSVKKVFIVCDGRDEKAKSVSSDF